MKGNKGFYLVAIVAVIALCGVGTAQASGWLGSTNFTTSTPIGSTLLDWTQSLTFPKYDPAWGGGTLTQIDFTVTSSSLDTYFSITNNSSEVSTCQSIKAEITISINDPGLLLAFTNLNPWIDKLFPPGSYGWNLAAGSFTNMGTYSSSASGTANYTDAGVMSEFTGTGDILLPANARATTSITGYTGGNVDIVQITHGDLTGTITYWAVIPEPSTALLVGLGLAAVAWRLRRRS